jgi:hypothetical protein
VSRGEPASALQTPTEEASTENSPQSDADAFSADVDWASEGGHGTGTRDDYLNLKDSTNEIDIYHLIGNYHMANGVIVHVPAAGSLPAARASAGVRTSVKASTTVFIESVSAGRRVSRGSRR